MPKRAGAVLSAEQRKRAKSKTQHHAASLGDDSPNTESQDLVECQRCGKTDEVGFLLCDACPGGVHMYCAGLDSNPPGFFVCPNCQKEPALESAMRQVLHEASPLWLSQQEMQNRAINLTGKSSWTSQELAKACDQVVSPVYTGFVPVYIVHTENQLYCMSNDPNFRPSNQPPVISDSEDEVSSKQAVSSQSLDSVPLATRRSARQGQQTAAKHKTQHVQGPLSPASATVDSACKAGRNVQHIDSGCLDEGMAHSSARASVPEPEGPSAQQRQLRVPQNSTQSAENCNTVVCQWVCACMAGCSQHAGLSIASQVGVAWACLHLYSQQGPLLPSSSQWPAAAQISTPQAVAAVTASGDCTTKPLSPGSQQAVSQQPLAEQVKPDGEAKLQAKLMLVKEEAVMKPAEDEYNHLSPADCSMSAAATTEALRFLEAMRSDSLQSMSIERKHRVMLAAVEQIAQLSSFVQQFCSWCERLTGWQAQLWKQQVFQRMELLAHGKNFDAFAVHKFLKGYWGSLQKPLHL